MRSHTRSAAYAALAFFISSCADVMPTAPTSAASPMSIGSVSAFIAPTASVRITEIHYDNAGTDAGERIELTGPAGMSLAGWQIVLYNGNGGAFYSSVTFAAEALDLSCGASGTHTITYGTNGIQNGSPDGVALVDPAGTVVEFLSYEGTFTAAGGPAHGMGSTDILVAQAGDGSEANSLLRTALATWATDGNRTCNFTDAPPPPADVASVTVEPATTTLVVGTVQSLAATARDASGTPVAATFTWSSSDEGVATVTAAGSVTGVAAGTATITATSNGESGSAVATVEEATTPPSGAVWLSEIHYDNSSTDLNEGVEIEAPAGTSLTGWQVYLYNGGNTPLAAPTYSPTTALSGTILDQCDGRGTLSFPIPGIQNGHPDAIALVDASGTVVDFIAYGGAITGGNGPAAGTAATVMGVKEGSSTQSTESLQRTGGVWVGPVASTFGACNGAAEPPPPPPPTKRITFSGRSNSDPALPAGFEDQLFATYLVDGAMVPTTFTWSSANESIATVDEDGVVHAVAEGSVRIEARTPDGTDGSWTIETTAGTFSSTANYLNSTEFGLPVDNDAADDYIVVRPQFTSSYSYERNTPNWASWTLDATQFGSEDRCDCFTMDPMLPPSFVRVTTADYTGSSAAAGYGIDRGHLVRSSDRTAGPLDNAATYLLSNIIPQAADNNQGPWASLENDLGARARAEGVVVYNVAGVAGANGTLKDEGVVTIPAYVWKVAVIMPRGEGLDDVASHDDLEVIAVVLPNVPDIRDVTWESYRVTVDSVEALSGYDVLALLRDDIEVAVESNTVPPVAALDGPYTVMEGLPLAVSGIMSSDADGQPLTYAWSFGDGVTATGVTAVHTYTSTGSYMVRLVVTDALGLADTVSVQATVTSIASNLQHAITLAEGLVSRGAINNGNGRAIIVKLESTIRALSADRANAPVHLGQAASQLDAFVAGGHVSAADAAPVRALMADIIRAMGG